MMVTEQAAMNQQSAHRMVIGVGNVYRSDDGVGILVVRRLQEKAVDLHVFEASGEGASLMAMWTPSDHVVIVDAVRSGCSPGKIHRLDAHQEPIPSEFFNYSTHAFSVAEAVEMSRALSTLPASLVIYGVEGKKFSPGSDLSPEVLEVLDKVANLVAAELGAKRVEANTAVSRTQEVPRA